MRYVYNDGASMREFARDTNIIVRLQDSACHPEGDTVIYVRHYAVSGLPLLYMTFFVSRMCCLLQMIVSYALLATL
jgi:hypothetical protein